MKSHLVSVVLLCGGALFADSQTRPNVILFVVDDMGWMDSEPYGSTYYSTPHMSRLAEQSMRFTDAYALPLCSPTRASILTGQYSSRHGITSATGHQPPRPNGFYYLPESASPTQPWLMPISKNYLDLDQYTLAEALRDAGYRTGHFGKWHLGLTSEYRPDKHGFDVTWGCAPDPGPPNYFSPYGVFPDGRPTGQHHVGNITDGPDGEHITDRLTDEAIGFIEQADGQPFFLNLWQYSVHGPWQHKKEYTAQYADKSDPNGRQSNPVMGSMLQNVDESLGRILDTLHRLDLTDNTLFIFYSDNGGNKHSWTADDRKIANLKPSHPKYEDVASYRRWAGDQPPTNNAPLRDGKGRIYEGGQRVPLMVRWPGRVAPGTTTNAVVGPIDVYPTILEAVALEPSKQQLIDGESLVPVLTQQGKLQRDAYFTWFPHLTPGVSVRQGDWKLIRLFNRSSPGTTLELYNLKDDIGETTNLATMTPAKAAELDALIDDFVKETKPVYPAPNPRYQPRESNESNEADPARGLVPKQCAIELIDAAVRVSRTGRNAFLGTAQVRMPGPLTLKLRARTKSDGVGKIQWRMSDQEEFPANAQMIDYKIAGSDDWQDIKIDIPINGRPSLVRLYLPTGAASMDIQSIEYRNAKSQTKAWRFESVKAVSN